MIRMMHLCSNKLSRTPLHTAIKSCPRHTAIGSWRSYEISRMLIEYGGDLEARDLSGATPLHTYPNEALHQILQVHYTYVDLSIQNSCGMTLLHYLAWCSGISREIFQRSHHLSNVDLRSKDRDGRSMLHLTVQGGNVPVLEYLLQVTPPLDIDGGDRRGKTALHYAVENNRCTTTIISLLVSHGANVGAKDYQSRSPLHTAAKFRKLHVLKPLLDSGAVDEMCKLDYCGKTPLQLSMIYTTFEVLSQLAKCESDLENPSGKITRRLSPRPPEEETDFDTQCPASWWERRRVLFLEPRKDWRELYSEFQRRQQRNSDDSPKMQYILVLLIIWTLSRYLA